MIQLWQASGSDWIIDGLVLTSGEQDKTFKVEAGHKICSGVTNAFVENDSGMKNYVVTVKTGDSYGAGTNCPVKVNLVGTKGNSFKYEV